MDDDQAVAMIAAYLLVKWAESVRPYERMDEAADEAWELLKRVRASKKRPRTRRPRNTPRLEQAVEHSDREPNGAEF